MLEPSTCSKKRWIPGVCPYLEEMVDGSSGGMDWGTHPTSFKSLDQTTASNRLANIIFAPYAFLTFYSYTILENSRNWVQTALILRVPRE